MAADVYRQQNDSRNYSVALNKLGDIARTRGDIDEAHPLFSESLDIRRQLADELGTPEARRNLAVSHARLALLARESGRGEQEAAHWQQALEAALEYQRRMPCPDADSIVAAIKTEM